MRVLLDLLMAVTLWAPPIDHPVEYTATNPAGALIVFHPERGWVGRGDCPWGCYVQADVPVQLLSGEVDVATLAAWDVTVRRDGEPVAQFWVMPFGGVPSISIP